MTDHLLVRPGFLSCSEPRPVDPFGVDPELQLQLCLLEVVVTDTVRRLVALLPLERDRAPRFECGGVSAREWARRVQVLEPGLRDRDPDVWAEVTRSDLAQRCGALPLPACAGKPGPFFS